MQMVSHPGERPLAYSLTAVAADQLVVVRLREREREMEADRGIKSDSAALSPAPLCWLSSSKQIETNRICRSCLQ